MRMQEQNQRKGPWSSEEDEWLKTFVALLGERRWDSIAIATGLRRSGKSCRLRWLNYLRPNLKRSRISPEEEKIILHLHQRWGNKWAKIARMLPGRTDNEIKNYWRTRLRKNNTFQIQPLEDEGPPVLVTNNNTKARSITRSDNSTSDVSRQEKLIKKDHSISSSGETRMSNSGDHYCDTCNELPTEVLVHATSPYENHFSNWLALLSPNGNEVLGFRWESGSGSGNGFGYPNVTHGEGSPCAHDYFSDALWNVI